MTPAFTLLLSSRLGICRHALHILHTRLQRLHTRLMAVKDNEDSGARTQSTERIIYSPLFLVLSKSLKILPPFKVY